MALLVRQSGHFLQALTILSATAALAGLTACGSELEGAFATDTVDTTDTVEVSDTDVQDTDTVDTVDSSGDSSPDTADADTVEADTRDTTPEVDTAPPPEWETVSLGDEGRVDALQLVSDTLGFAASGGRVLRWDGRLWSAFGDPFDTDVRGVYGTSDLVVAVGDGGRVATRPADGSEAWTAIGGAPEVHLRAVVFRTKDDIFVAGDKATVAHWDGTAWSTRFTSNLINLRAMYLRAGSTGDDGVYAVGSGGQLVAKVGDAWRATQIAANTVILTDILGLPNGTLIAVGNEHTITAKGPNDPTWKGQTTADERKRDVAGLALGADGVVRAFGSAGLVLAQSGVVWNLATGASVAAGLKDFAVADASPTGPLVMALGKDGGGVRFDGTTWASLATSPEATITDFAAGASGAIWATGSRGFLARHDASGWSSVPVPTTNDLHSVDVTAGGIAWVVGAKGTVLRVAPGEKPVLVTTPIPLDLYGVVAVGEGAVACGRGGTLLAVTEAGVVVQASGTTADLKAITKGGDGRIWISGSFGALLRLPADVGGVVEAIASGIGGSLNDLAASSDGVYAVGDNGAILRATATNVTVEAESPGRFLYAVATGANGRAVAVGSGGALLRKTASGWVADVPTETGATFEAVYLAADGSVAIAGGIYRVSHVETRLTPVEAP